MGVSRFVLGVAAVSLVGVLSFAPGCSGDDASRSASQQIGKDTIGASGGEIDANGVKLTVPAGALDRSVTITVDVSSDPSPPGYVAVSPVFVFGPEGLTFARPITVTMAFNDDGRPASAFWSTTLGDGFDDIGGTASAGQMTAQVTHFSRGFVGRHKGQGDDAGADSQSDAGSGVDSSSGSDSGSAADGSDASTSSDSAVADSGVDSGSACTCPIATKCCAGQCVDVKSSPINCGGCGISCGAGTCSNGFCSSCMNLGQQCAGSCCQGLVCVGSICQYAVP
jgi:hypothetical protein